MCKLFSHNFNPFSVTSSSLVTKFLTCSSFYGTLKKDFPNSYCLADVKFVGEAQTVDKYPLIVASRFNIPYLLGAKGVGNQIGGEVYDVTDCQLKVLDTLERYPEFYNRIEIPIELAIDCKVISCSTYVLDRYKDSLLQCKMLKSYSRESSMHYVKPCDRSTQTTDHRDDVMDYSK